jgi:hypothetical protein
MNCRRLDFEADARLEIGKSKPSGFAVRARVRLLLICLCVTPKALATTLNLATTTYVLFGFPPSQELTGNKCGFRV